MTRFTGSMGVIGAGRLGTALARALVQRGYRVDKVASRAPSSGGRLASRLPAASLGTLAEVVASTDFVFVTVADGAIEGVAKNLAWRPGQAVVHCSGALGLEVLAGATARGAIAGCFHPLQSFAAEAAPDRFDGITIGIEGAEPLGGWLESMAADLGARTVRLEGVDRALYHAAAALVSNDLVALVAAASRTWEAAGLPREAAREALAPLILGAARNIEAQPLERALTGPVARGDVATVARHLAALAAIPDLALLYRALGRELLRLPLAIDAVARDALEAMFAEEGA